MGNTMTDINSVYFDYIIANSAKSFFKEKLEEIDVENKYVKANYILDINKEKLDSIKESDVNYKEAVSNVENDLKIWRENNRSFYRMQPSLPSSKIFNVCIPILDLKNVTLDGFVQAYKAAGEMLKTIPNSSLDIYCTELKPMLNQEHKGAYEKVKEDLRKLYKVPSDEDLISSYNLQKETIKKTKK